MRNRFLHAIGLLFAVAAASCSSDKRKPVYPTDGQVLWQGKPAAKAMVVFHPLEKADFGSTHPFAFTDKDGRFKLTTYDANDGLPVGKYAVTVVWISGGAPLEENQNEEDEQAVTNSLPTAYSKPESSGLRVEITEGPNSLAPFQLKP